MKDLTLEEGDSVEYLQDGVWKPGVITDTDTEDENYPYQIRGDDTYAYWGHSGIGVRRPLDEEKPELPPVPDMVNHPPHYTGHPKGIECIDVIEENPFPNLAAAIKYLWRVSWGSKGNDIEDLQKAVWFIEREIGRRNG